MVVEIAVEGMESYLKTAEEHKSKVVFALFSGSVDASGKNWCPDCVTADPVIEANLKYAPKDAVFIHCGVGARDFWKDPNCVFRTHPDLKLKSVPTLIRVGQAQRLVESQCAKADMVKMLFEEE